MNPVVDSAKKAAQSNFDNVKSGSTPVLIGIAQRNLDEALSIVQHDDADYKTAFAKYFLACQ